MTTKTDESIKQPTGVLGELFAAGAHFGYSRARRHPSVRDFIFGFKNRTAIIDLEKTVADLAKAEKFITQLAEEGKTVIWVGAKAEARNAITKAATSLSLPYVAERWIGGTLTNFAQISKRIDRLVDLKDKRDKGELSVYTKKEQLLIGREIADLERCFGTIVSLAKPPAAMVVVDPSHEAIAVAEAKELKIPVIALASSDCNISGLAYPVVANDAAEKSISLFVSRLATAYAEGKTAAQKAALANEVAA